MAPPHRHSRSSSAGSAYHFILEHVLSYPGTYEIPLRTMYTLNCAPRAQSQSPVTRSPSPTSTGASPTSPSFPWHDHQAATAHFTQSLIQQISQLPQQPSSLPPSFVTSFLNRCFSPELEFVDFAQGLTGLDYLKDLEYRRRKEIAHILARMGIDANVLKSATGIEHLLESYPHISESYPHLAEWILSLDSKGRKADNLYTQLYVSLRRWLLINEMSLRPFNKNNCHAMLNTLYPPVMSSPPSAVLSLDKLAEQRNGFFKWIQTVQRRDPSCLQPLINQGRREGDENGWAAVRRTLSNYLTLANSTINECQDKYNMDLTAVVNRTPTVPPMASRPDSEVDGLSRRKARKTDSGVSFNSASSDGKHSKTTSTSSASTASKSSFAFETRPLTPRRPDTPSSSGRTGSTLERIARELRRMRPRGRIEVDEIVKPSDLRTLNGDGEKENAQAPSTPHKSRFPGLRKMRSFGALGDLKHNNSSATVFRSPSAASGGVGNFVPDFNVEEMKRQRAAYERRMRHA